MGEPLAPGSVSLRLYPHQADPATVMAHLREQAAAAVAAGYDGVMVSEHHAGFVGYHPHPVQLAGLLLAAMPSGWAAPCPLLLPLRAPGMLAEELGWLAAAFPGRVGAGFAAGSLAVDFEVAGVPFEEMGERFRRSLPEIVALLSGRGEGPASTDPAVAALAGRTLPMVVAAQSLPAVRRAAANGIGLLFDSLQTPEVVRRLTDAYREAGGSAPAILIRRVWVGDPPSDAFAAQTDRYRTYAAESAMRTWGGNELVAGADAGEAAARLAEVVDRCGCDAVNLRIHAIGLGPAEIADQIARHGDGFVTAVRHAIRP